MMESRRRLLKTLCLVGVPLGLPARARAAQAANPRRQPPTEQKDDEAAPKIDSKTILQSNEKDIKKNVERLYELASELKAEVEKTDSVKVLSLAMLRKAEEIEKLAKEIKTRAKG